MIRYLTILTALLFAAPLLAADHPASRGPQERTIIGAPPELKDLYYGEALYDAFRGEWFDAIARLDTELEQFHGLDEPARDTLYLHINQAEFAVGDFELAYRMHRRAGRAISAVIEGDVTQAVRNEAIYRLARIYFHKDQPQNALLTINRIEGQVPAGLRDDLAFLRAHILMANGRFSEAEHVLRDLQGARSLTGFATYNLGIDLLKQGKVQEGRRYLDQTGLIASDDRVTRAIKDKANLLLGGKLLEEQDFSGAKDVLDRVHLEGPFSNRALLGSGWADASRGQFEKALVPWSLLTERAVTDSAVQEGLLALPYAYGKLGVFSKAALLYDSALETFGKQIDRLGASIKSIREGRFLKALTREEFKQNPDWVIRLRELPETPETYYLFDLMASHDFQESLKNYLDLEQLRRKLERWQTDLDAFDELIARRRGYYQPLLPKIDTQFRRLDAQMRLRLEQRDQIARRLKAMLVAPRPDYLATAQERIATERLSRLERAIETADSAAMTSARERVKRLRGVLRWNLRTDYDRRLTQTYRDLQELNLVVERLNQQYTSFVRTRQAATQSYAGYDQTIRLQRQRIITAQGQVEELMARQGHLLEVMAVNELTARLQRLDKFQVKARFAMADSYDRAARTQDRLEGEK